jgi:hypothetical protein
VHSVVILMNWKRRLNMTHRRQSASS